MTSSRKKSTPNRAASKPAAKMTARKPAAKKAASKPAAKKAASKPAAKTTARKPAAKKAASKPPAKKATPSPSSAAVAPAGPAPQSSTTHLLKKGKGVVDPHFAMASRCRVLEDNGTVYQCTLNQTNVGDNNNKFYIIQLLQDETSPALYLFTRWGRVGVPGQQATETCADLASAKRLFCSKYREKTRNEFGSPAFVKVPGKYQRMDIDYGDAAEEEGSACSPKKKMAKKEPASPSPPKSRLPPKIQELISMISSQTAMSNTMHALSIDTKRMPLGKISKEQIKSAYQCLKAIEDELKKKAPNVEELTSQFYTLIPHDFGFRRPPLISDAVLLKSKMEMLDALAQLEISSTLLKRGKSEEKNVLDTTYAALKCELTPLASSSKEYARVVEYARNTTGATHTLYSLHVEEVFRVDREGESERYAAATTSIGNRTMLWHGSRTTNFVGILSQGLRIAPKEAPVTGYMFGKGIYLADTCTKSANYCFTSSQHNKGLMLLCEAALGKPREYVDGCYMEKAQPGFDSTKGLGRMHPDPAGSTKVQGVLWPKGTMVTDAAQLKLQYPEYIIYDPAQCCMRYLVKMRFDYKR